MLRSSLGLCEGAKTGNRNQSNRLCIRRGFHSVWRHAACWHSEGIAVPGLRIHSRLWPQYTRHSLADCSTGAVHYILHSCVYVSENRNEYGQRILRGLGSNGINRGTDKVYYLYLYLNLIVTINLGSF